MDDDDASLLDASLLSASSTHHRSKQSGPSISTPSNYTTPSAPNSKPSLSPNIHQSVFLFRSASLQICI
ncbi:hypothetical protein L1987_75510 [Smallanthus sonchifolius]|uniref:Uncharacterized protein n=1 Tax=Smallanthus sonchifolius TaxID=185202 RepID=A0ACB9A5R0_9ASTR|nr:hypothetical protein L1987_75510 [Smallanthus sonchifolius]